MGPWWLSIGKLEAELKQLTSCVDAIRACHPHLRKTSAMLTAEAELARCALDLDRARKPECPERLLAVADAAIVRAGRAVEQARALALMAQAAARAETKWPEGELVRVAGGSPPTMAFARR